MLPPKKHNTVGPAHDQRRIANGMPLIRVLMLRPYWTVIVLLYMPREWCNDPEWRARAKVPEGVSFQTRSQRAIAMLEHAWEQNVPMRWVTGDELYGDATDLRDTVIAHNRLYVLAVSQNTPVWTEQPPLQAPGKPRTGRPRTECRMRAGSSCRGAHSIHSKALSVIDHGEPVPVPPDERLQIVAILYKDLAHNDIVGVDHAQVVQEFLIVGRLMIH